MSNKSKMRRRIDPRTIEPTLIAVPPVVEEAPVPTEEGPSSFRYELKITASGEVRDADGNLISSEPLSQTVTLTADQVRELKENGDLDGIELPEGLN